MKHYIVSMSCAWVLEGEELVLTFFVHLLSACRAANKTHEET